MTDQVNDRTFKPLYLKDSDVQCCDNNRVTDFMLMERVTEVIGNALHCLQLDRNLWRIYVKSQDSRDKLLVEGISIQNISVTLFDTNPYSSGNHDPTVKTLKIRLCGLPYLWMNLLSSSSWINSASNQKVKYYMKKSDIP